MARSLPLILHAQMWDGHTNRATRQRLLLIHRAAHPLSGRHAARIAARASTGWRVIRVWQETCQQTRGMAGRNGVRDSIGGSPLGEAIRDIARKRAPDPSPERRRAGPYVNRPLTKPPRRLLGLCSAPPLLSQTRKCYNPLSTIGSRAPFSQDRAG